MDSLHGKEGGCISYPHPTDTQGFHVIQARGQQYRGEEPPSPFPASRRDRAPRKIPRNPYGDTRCRSKHGSLSLTGVIKSMILSVRQSLIREFSFGGT